MQRFSDSRAYVWRTARISVNAHGAPNAYHSEDRGLDGLANAGWRSVPVPDPGNPSKPFVRQTGAFAGYFLSATTLQDRSKASTDPARHVDAASIPYTPSPAASTPWPAPAGSASRPTW